MFYNKLNILADCLLISKDFQLRIFSDSEKSVLGKGCILTFDPNQVIMAGVGESSLLCQIALLSAKCNLLNIVLKHLSCYNTIDNFFSAFFSYMDSYFELCSCLIYDYIKMTNL